MPANAWDVRILGQQVTPDGKQAVVYLYSIPDQQFSWMKENIVGYSIVERVDWLFWRTGSTYSIGASLPRKLDAYPDYGIFQDGYTAVYGPMDEAEVQAVEVDFADGATQREERPADYFLFFSPSGMDVCALRFLGGDDELISEVYISPLSEYGDECPKPGANP
ncbi:MAG: hypothetical protein DWQ07_01485 [Chloroflexi bacterium]|nr:MAG: hypothetical protein DWQ07_01485 [Chloroflexota bacterium]MBL1193831.1 hypothetical protein [Chloroflexota bacterium]